MNDILAEEVMIRDIYIIHSDNRVALARLRMLRHGVGALPVIDKERGLKGIITLRDIDLAGSEAFPLLVEDLMTANLVTGGVETTMREIVEKMLKTGIQRIPIIDDDGKLVGLVTQTTVIRAAKECFDRLSDRGARLQGLDN